MRVPLLCLVFMIVFTAPLHAESRILFWNVQDFCPHQGDECTTPWEERAVMIEEEARNILDSNINMVCLCEVETEGFNHLLTALNEFSGEAWESTQLENLNDNGEENPSKKIFDDDIMILYNAAKYELADESLIEGARKGGGLRAPLSVRFWDHEYQQQFHIIVLHAKARESGSAAVQKAQFKALSEFSNVLLADAPNTSLMLIGDWNNAWFTNSSGTEAKIRTVYFQDYEHIVPDRDDVTHLDAGGIDHAILRGRWSPFEVSGYVLGDDESEKEWQGYSDHHALLVTIAPKRSSWE